MIFNRLEEQRLEDEEEHRKAKETKESEKEGEGGTSAQEKSTGQII